MKSLKDARNINAIPLALDALIGLATLLLKQPYPLQSQRQAQGEEILVFVTKHPASEQETRLRAAGLRERFSLGTGEAHPVDNDKNEPPDLSQMARKVSRLFT